MRIERTSNDNITISFAKNNNTAEDTNSSSAQKNKKNSSIIYAGDTNLNNDTIALKKQQAKKQALKTIMDQYKKEKKTDDLVTTLRDKEGLLNKDMDTAAGMILDLKAKREDLKVSSGLTDESLEQKNLVLLEKSIYEPDSMTEEDMDQLQNIGPLTEYQKTAIHFGAMQKVWQQRVDNAAAGITNITQSINGISLAKLKTHPMIDAQKQAAQIIEDSIKEVVNTIIEQTKENVDDTIEKNKEEAQKQQEEQDKKDAAAGKPSNNTLPTSELTEQLQLADDLKRFAIKENLLEEDIKGILVDEEV